MVILTSALFAENLPDPGTQDGETPRVRLERTPVGNGADLLTVFVALPAGQALHYREMPVLTLLRDTLGTPDPESERLRDVWLLTAGRPSAVHRVMSAVPFIYWLHTPKPSSSAQPVRLMDFGAPLRQTEGALAGLVVQGELLDPSGRSLRTTTRSFRMNDADDRSARSSEAMAALADAEDDAATPPDEADDLARLHARLLLSDSLLGGLVRDQSLPAYFDRQRTEREISRGHNWDLLRQAAESDGLYFEPLSFDGDKPSYAMLWVRRGDLEHAPQRFDAKLLHISNPFHDARIARWRGYTEQWWFDCQGSPVEQASAGARQDFVIPLALYSLDHPRVPLLLVDFQNGGAPRRRENVGQAADDVTRGLLGLSPIANWDYFVARSVVTFVLHRHGAALDRTTRVRAWAELSYALSTGGEVRPGLRETLEQHVHAPVFDPQDEKVDAEAALAWERWRFLTGAQSPAARIVEEHRKAELAALEHGRPARFGFAMLRGITFGTYRHKDNSDDIIARLDWARRLEWNHDFLDRVAKSAPPLELTWDADRVRRSVEEVARLTALQPVSHDTISGALAQVAVNTDDEAIRHLCLEALNRMETAAARKELLALAHEPGRFNCPICREYLARGNASPSPSAGPPGGAQ